MATAITCDMCQQETAQVMQTNIDNGDVLAIGASCQLLFHLTVAAEMLDLMPGDARGAYSEVARRIITALSDKFTPPVVATPVLLDEDPLTGDMVPVDADGRIISSE